MKCSKQEVLQYVQEEDVKFIRLAFCDVFGKQKNISIMAEELPRAFEHGISFDASAITGFGDETHSDLSPSGTRYFICASLETGTRKSYSNVYKDHLS